MRSVISRYVIGALLSCQALALEAFSLGISNNSEVLVYKLSAEGFAQYVGLPGV